MGYGSLSRVLTGWTGSIVVTYLGVTITVTPERESVASLIARLVEAVAPYGLTLTVSVSSASVITLTGSAAFDLTLSGNSATRTGFTGSYTSATTYTAAAGYANAWTPANGMRLGGVLFASTKTSATGDGGLAGSPARISGTARLVAWDSQLAIADFGYEYDVWHDGRLFGRFIARDVRRVPLGRLRNTTTVSVEIDALEVA